MIEHLVLFKFKESTTEDSKNNMLEKLLNLKNEIKEIREISCGENFTDRSKGFEFGLRVLFDSKDDLNTYAVHPAHVAVVEEIIKPIISDIIALDYVR